MRESHVRDTREVRPGVPGGGAAYFGVNPNDELITNAAVTAANTADREVIDELLNEPATGAPAADTESGADKPAADTGEDSSSSSQRGSEPKDFEVYGDSAYADGATLG